MDFYGNAPKAYFSKPVSGGRIFLKITKFCPKQLSDEKKSQSLSNHVMKDLGVIPV